MWVHATSLFETLFKLSSHDKKNTKQNSHIHPSFIHITKTSTLLPLLISHPSSSSMEVSTSSSSMPNKPDQALIPSPTTKSHHHHQQHHQHHHLSSPYPTTFVQADTSTFKQVVQMLTGSSSSDAGKHPEPPSPATSRGTFSIPPIGKSDSFKLYERRQNNNNNMFKNDLMINTLRVQNCQRLMFSNANNSPRFSPRNSENTLVSPSMLEFPKLGLNSPVTPLKSNEDLFNKASSSPLSEEEKGIAEKGFYLHDPSPSPRDSLPQLLPLFPLTSPTNNR